MPSSLHHRFKLQAAFDGLDLLLRSAAAEVPTAPDQPAISIAGVIEPTLQAAEIRRLTHDLTAYNLYLPIFRHYLIGTHLGRTAPFRRSTCWGRR